MDLQSQLTQVRQKHPLVQCITTFVTVNDCANILLAADASPTMAMEPEEAADAVERTDALVCNMGAISYVESMCLAGKRANACGIPVVLDPVGAGGTAIRRERSAQLLQQVRFAVIRGNASEIRALARTGSGGSGVDVSEADAVTSDNLEESTAFVRALAARLHTVIAVSGALDLLSDGARVFVGKNGCSTMARITGSGCMLTTLIGAFCGAAPETPFEAACAAVTAMGVAGELAEARRLRFGTGNATFRSDLIDAVFNLNENQLKEMGRYEIYI